MTVPALIDAECSVACNPRRLKCPAPGTSAPHSTRRRVDRCKCLIVDGRITNPLRRGGPPRPPARIGMKMGFIVMVLSFIDVDTPLAGWDEISI